ncbi:MAG: PAS domain S-box protein [Pseudomonadota bacterium]
MKHKLLFGFLFYALCSCLYLFHIIYTEAKEKAIADLNSRQMIHARQAQRGIEEFFSNLIAALTKLSGSGHIIDMDDWGRREMEFALTIHPEAIKAVTRLDASGRIIYSSPYDSALIGRDISGQKHVQEIMKTHRPVIGDVFRAVQGNEAVALHVPVFKENEYAGTLAVLIDFRVIAGHFVADIHIGETGYAWMTNKEGTELYCPVPGHTGKSVFENCKEFPTILSMASEMLQGREGTTVYFFDRIRDQRRETVKKHAVYLPLKIADSFWSIVVASSEDELLSSLVSFRNKILAVAGLLLFFSSIFFYYGTKAWGIFREAAARRKAEEALRASEIKYRELFERSPVGIFKTDSAGRALFVNPEMARIVGTASPEEAVKNFQNLARDLYVDPGRRKAFITLIKDRGGVENFEYEARRLDGKHIWLSMNARAREIAADGTFIIDGFTTDITERKQAEAAFRESEEIFEQFLEHSPIYIFFKDEMIRSIRLSRNFETMLARPLDQILGKTMDDLFPSDLAKSMIADDRRILSEGKVIQVEEELNGRFYATIKFPIYLHGKPRYLAGYTVDITERRQAEAEKRHLEDRLQRAEKMEALGTLAGGVAHDLNNVLGVVVGYSELLLDDLAPSSPLRRGIETILTGGQKAAAIVQDLLTLARRGVPGRSVLNLNKVIVANLNSPEFETLSSHHCGVRIRTALEPDLLNISGSTVHLGKSLFNLVSNAAEAMPKGGELTIKTANRYLDTPLHGYDEIREGDYVVLSVSDTGEGIPAADLNRIFEPFYTKKMMGRSGTGLGLAVVWGTVKDHHGYINVQSEAERGSTFNLYFPVTREEVTAEAVRIPLSEYRGKGETILVVDDVQEQRNLATAMLKKLHYTVESVAGGQEALAYLKVHSVDLMVLDMIMDPGMDGLDTYRGALQLHPKQKAVIVSGFSESERVSAAQALGAGPYVRKPYVMEKLGLAVRKELDRAGPRREPPRMKTGRVL